MRSEIPQLEVITAIHDSESEDFVSQLLFSQGWNIIYRAFDAASLTRFMHSRGSELRTVIIYMTDLPNFDPVIFGGILSIEHLMLPHSHDLCTAEEVNLEL